MAQDVAFLLIFAHLISKFVMPPEVYLSLSVCDIKNFYICHKTWGTWYPDYDLYCKTAVLCC